MKNLFNLSFLLITVNLLAQKNSNDSIYSKMSTKDTVIIGKAMNAKAGGVIIDLNENTYYVEGVSSWNEKTEGKILRVTGRLALKEFAGGKLPADKSEPLVASMEGPMTVIVHAKWKILKRKL